MAKKKQKPLEVFESEWFCITLLVIASLIALLEVVALIKGINGTMFGATMAALGGIGGFLVKGFLKDSGKK